MTRNVETGFGAGASNGQPLAPAFFDASPESGVVDAPFDAPGDVETRVAFE